MGRKKNGVFCFSPWTHQLIYLFRLSVQRIMTKNLNDWIAAWKWWIFRMIVQKKTQIEDESGTVKWLRFEIGI